ELRLPRLRELLPVELHHDRLRDRALDRDDDLERSRGATSEVGRALGADVGAAAPVAAAREAERRPPLRPALVLAHDLDLVTAGPELARRDPDLEVRLLRGGDLPTVEEDRGAAQAPRVDADLQLESVRDAALVDRQALDLG